MDIIKRLQKQQKEARFFTLTRDDIKQLLVYFPTPAKLKKFLVEIKTPEDIIDSIINDFKSYKEKK